MDVHVAVALTEGDLSGQRAIAEAAIRRDQG
jgi:hypothetical protein